MSNAKRILLLIGWMTMTAATGPSAVRAAGPASNAAGSRFRLDPATVERHGPGYRHPQAGWIVLHIEGEPYDRGYQHGRLMAPEIARFIPELARYRSTRAPADAWRDLRLLADALFLRRFDPEYLEEMKGIADGAAAAGARFDGRPVDLLDVVTINADIETNFLEAALEATATGLEGRRFREPAERGPIPARESHCSAFAATGPTAAALQRDLAARFANVRVPLKADVDVDGRQLKDAHIVLVGRPSIVAEKLLDLDLALAREPRFLDFHPDLFLDRDFVDEANRDRSSDRTAIRTRCSIRSVGRFIEVTSTIAALYHSVGHHPPLHYSIRYLSGLDSRRHA